jgi:hexose kinase, 1-phosphofructokinase family
MTRAAKDLHAQGVENVMVLDLDGNAILACKEGTFHCDVLDPTTIVNTVGTGDSLVAGFLMEYNRSRNIVDSFRFGASCGSATAYSKGMATREKIESFSHSVEVRKID